MRSYMLLFVLCLAIGAATASTRDYVNVTYVKDEFVGTYVHTTVYRDYVFGVSISTLEAQQAFHDIVLTHDEDWSSLCLDVMLNAPLPELLSKLLPSHFLDIRVFYRVAGNEDTVCTEDAMICPDGTAVGRSGPNCEFVCPSDSFCIEDTAVCADGTVVGRTGQQCTFQCPTGDSTITGSTNETLIREIQENFLTRYQDEYPYSKYLTAIYSTTLNNANQSHPISLGPNESWSSYCIVVLLIAEPTDCEFPKTYQGARVFYEIGGICPMSNLITSDCTVVDYGTVVSFNLIYPIVFVLCAGVCACLCCCAKKRKCKQNCKAQAPKVNSEGFHRLPEDPNMVPIMMAPMMYHPEFDLEMMNGEQHPYEPVMIPVGYPMYPPQQQE